MCTSSIWRLLVQSWGIFTVSFCLSHIRHYADEAVTRPPVCSKTAALTNKKTVLATATNTVLLTHMYWSQGFLILLLVVSRYVLLDIDLVLAKYM